MPLLLFKTVFMNHTTKIGKIALLLLYQTVLITRQRSEKAFGMYSYLLFCYIPPCPFSFPCMAAFLKFCLFWNKSWIDWHSFAAENGHEWVERLGDHAGGPTRFQIHYRQPCLGQRVCICPGRCIVFLSACRLYFCSCPWSISTAPKLFFIVANLHLVPFVVQPHILALWNFFGISCEHFSLYST